MYIVAVELTTNNSFQIRKLLSSQRFTIFFFNELTKQLDLDHTDYGRNGGLVLMVPTDLAKITKYHCIYNGRKLPDQEIFKAIENDPAVITYCIEKRQ